MRAEPEVEEALRLEVDQTAWQMYADQMSADLGGVAVPIVAQ